MKTNHRKRKALATAVAIGLGVGSAFAQTKIEVGGDGVIADEILPTDAVPISGATYKTNGGTGIVQSHLVSPAATVTSGGNVTLRFTHRYDFEDNWDGGAVFVSVDGAPATYLPLSAFSSNGYDGDTQDLNGSNAWPDGEDVFTLASLGYDDPALVESVVDLGSIAAGQTVAVEFRGWWDDAALGPEPNWEIATVTLEDASSSAILDVDFQADGESGFTVNNIGSVAGPWTYLRPVSTFEIDADSLTADRYAPSTPGADIDLNGSVLAVEVLNGTPEVGDTFKLFDLSGGTTLTGTFSSLTLPPGTWDTSNFLVDGTITMTELPPLTTPGTDFVVDASGDEDGDEFWEDQVSGKSLRTRPAA